MDFGPFVKFIYYLLLLIKTLNKKKSRKCRREGGRNCLHNFAQCLTTFWLFNTYNLLVMFFFYQMAAIMVFCYQNCSDILWETSDREKLLKSKAEGREFAKITRTIFSKSERSEHFLVTKCFFNLFLEVSHI